MSTKLPLIVLLVTFLTIKVQAQIDTTIKIDLLRAPSSPASNLLGIAESAIEKPSEVSAVMTSLRSATNNFTSLPKSFALDLAPFKILGKRFLDSKYIDDNKYAVKQSMVVSFGINSVDNNDSVPTSLPKTQVGLGVKFSLVRGKLDEATRNAFDNIYILQRKDEQLPDDIRKEAVRLQNEENRFRDSLKKAKKPGQDSTILAGWKFKIDSIKNLEFEVLSKDTLSLTKVYNALIKKEAAKIKMERTGFNLDFSAGTVLDFLENKFNNSKITKTGAWLTGGYTADKTPISVLGIVRYLYNPKTSFTDPNIKLENLHTLDMGARFIATPMDKELLLSAEGIYRSILNKATATSSWRLVLNVEYEVAINQRLTFSFGRNFDGEIYKGGNLISALHYIVGFGNDKVAKTSKGN